MKCPVCENTHLLMSDRQGIEFDYCPQCRGIWLDRGELDKLIERSNGIAAPSNTSNPMPQASMSIPNSNHIQPQQTMQQAPYPQTQYPQHQKNHSNYPHSSHSGSGYYKKKKEGFLSELFDFD